MTEEFQDSPTADDAPILFRSSTVADVNYSQRIIEVIAAPYNEEAVVPWRGESWREMFLRGAWDGIEKRPNRVRANRDHDMSRTIGKVTAFYPSRAEGLVASVRIAKTPLGDETLALADDDCLGASVGYKARPSDVILNRANRTRQVKRAFVDHLAFAADELYAGAHVLAVRSAAGGLLSPDEIRAMEKPAETPMLDELRDWMAARQR